MLRATYYSVSAVVQAYILCKTAQYRVCDLFLSGVLSDWIVGYAILFPLRLRGNMMCEAIERLDESEYSSTCVCSVLCRAALLK